MGVLSNCCLALSLTCWLYLCFRKLHDVTLADILKRAFFLMVKLVMLRKVFAEALWHSCHILHAASSSQALISALTFSISTVVHFIIIVWIWILHLPQTGSPAHLEQVGWGKRLIFPRCGPDRGGGWARWWQPGSPRCASPPSPRGSPLSVANNFSGLRSWLRLLILTS